MASNAYLATAESLVFPVLERILNSGSDELSSLLQALTRQRIVIRAEQKNLESTMNWTSAGKVTPEQAGLEERLAVQTEAIHLLDRLIVSADRLNQATDRTSGFEAIQDVLANAVGIEQFALYEVDRASRNEARLVAYCCDFEPPPVVGENDLAAMVLQTHKRARNNEKLPNSDLPQLLCCPLSLGCEIRFLLIAIQLLPQVGALHTRDVPIFDLLERYAASVLVQEPKHR